MIRWRRQDDGEDRHEPRQLRSIGDVAGQRMPEGVLGSRSEGDLVDEFGLEERLIAAVSANAVNRLRRIAGR